jgi:hypothetical protein
MGRQIKGAIERLVELEGPLYTRGITALRWGGRVDGALNHENGEMVMINGMNLERDI